MATKPAGNAASRPYVCGSILDPATAPISVPRFQKTYTDTPVIQNAVARERRSACDVAIAVDSSMVSWAANNRRANEPSRCRAMVSPYTPLRAASTMALLNADPVVPPLSITLTAVNCDAPVNTNNDIAQACRTEPPADTAPTPNTMPNTPTTAPSVRLAETTGRSSGGTAAIRRGTA